MGVRFPQQQQGGGRENGDNRGFGRSSADDQNKTELEAAFGSEVGGSVSNGGEERYDGQTGS